MFALPSLMVETLPHISDSYWYPLWEICQELQMPIHFHASAGLGRKLTFPEWDGYTPYQQHAAFTVPTSGWPAQIVPNLIFSGIAYKFPRSKWVFAETGIGSVSCVQTACDHEWERRRLWRYGLDARPSELIRRQVYVNFWYEKAGIELREAVGVENALILCDQRRQPRDDRNVGDAQRNFLLRKGRCAGGQDAECGKRAESAHQKCGQCSG